MMSRLRLMAVLVPWALREPDGVRVAAACERFGLSETELEEFLDEEVIQIGVAPFSPSDFIDVQIVDGRVIAQPVSGFEDPPDPTPYEALDAYLTASAVCELEGFESATPLASACKKLKALVEAAGLDTRAAKADLELPGSEHVAALRAAASEGTRVSFQYRGAGAAGTTMRHVEPAGVFLESRSWYLDAFDVDAQGDRFFRLDRMQSLEGSEEKFSPRQMRSELTLASDQKVRIELVFREPASWVLDRLPADRSFDVASQTVQFESASTSWLIPLLLSAGARIGVLRPASLGESLRQAAQVALKNY